MDGIYSAAREIDEKTLFKEAVSILHQNTERSWREFAEDESSAPAVWCADAIALSATRVRVLRVDQPKAKRSWTTGSLARSLARCWRYRRRVWQSLGTIGLDGRKFMPPATSQAPAMRIADSCCRCRHPIKLLRSKTFSATRITTERRGSGTVANSLNFGWAISASVLGQQPS